MIFDIGGLSLLPLTDLSSLIIECVVLSWALCKAKHWSVVCVQESLRLFTAQGLIFLTLNITGIAKHAFWCYKIFIFQVTLKQDSSTQLVQDDQVKGPLRVCMHLFSSPKCMIKIQDSKF